MIRTESSNKTVILGEENPCSWDDDDICVWPERIMAESQDGESVVRVVAVECVYRLDIIQDGGRLFSHVIDGWQLGQIAKATCKAYTGKDLP